MDFDYTFNNKSEMSSLNRDILKEGRTVSEAIEPECVHALRGVNSMPSRFGHHLNRLATRDRIENFRHDRKQPIGRGRGRPPKNPHGLSVQYRDVDQFTGHVPLLISRFCTPSFRHESPFTRVRGSGIDIFAL
jgi:hypothetical protein